MQFLARLVELELIDRERRMIERRIKAAKFPVTKSLDTFDFKAIPSLNKMQVLELARCEWIERRENVIALGPSGTGKTHTALGLGLAACQKGLSVGFTTAAAIVRELMEARDERRLLRLQKQMANQKLRIIHELGFVPLSKTGAGSLFELIPQRYQRDDADHEKAAVRRVDRGLGPERLTGALLDRRTDDVNILELNGDSYRLSQSSSERRRQKPYPSAPGSARQAEAPRHAPASGERARRGAHPEWPRFVPPTARFCSDVDIMEWRPTDAEDLASPRRRCA